MSGGSGRPASVRDLRPIALSAYGPSALSAIGTGAITPVVALSARHLGAGVGLAAFMVALLGIGQLLGDLPAGAVAARFGERTALIGACGLEALGMLGSALAPNVAVLAASVLVLGVSASVFGLARQAYLTEVVPVALRARALSVLGGVSRIGLFVGPFLGAAAVSRWGVGAAYGVGLASSVSALLLLLVVPDLTSGERAEQLREPGRRSVLAVLGEHRRTLATLGVGVLFVSGARACRTAVVPLWAQAVGLDATHTSLVFGISGAVDMLLFYPGGTVMDRFGRVFVVVPSLVVLGIGMALLPLTGTFAWVTAVATLLGLGNGIGSGVVMTLGADASPDRDRAQFLGGWRLMSDAGNAAGPALLSAVTVVAPLAVGCVALGGLALVGAGWMRVWVPRFDPVSRRTLARRRGMGG
ncbi:MFS transporter [Lapillicoccus jejuensis]|uniref:Putative MFS family arabinose efflux permease n=1 Tax=Lapillicoccus jejuensis TaxID=402171 RepID=A0A542E0U6_9MICO|nr:MFS transporter [Lapillicoccus jejuensis]TQJ08970.1 putative MFS family arabinose efflux permease [Lapillicoccus jejuensis]